MLTDGDFDAVAACFAFLESGVLPSVFVSLSDREKAFIAASMLFGKGRGVSGVSI